jgi:predicted flap endonuclease-1-like 5' DNA nuclease
MVLVTLVAANLSFAALEALTTHVPAATAVRVVPSTSQAAEAVEKVTVAVPEAPAVALRDCVGCGPVAAKVIEETGLNPMIG